MTPLATASGQDGYGPAAGVDPGAGNPFGLAITWRSDEPQHGNASPARSASSFATNGSLVGIHDGSGIRVLRATDGAGVRWIPSLPHRDTYAFAVASDGTLAVGRIGGIELVHPGTRRSASRIPCIDACGPVQAVAFSPDGSLVAYQGARVPHDRARGLGAVTVVDAVSGEIRAHLEASAARAFVAFSSDGALLLTANVGRFDDSEFFGLRVWRTADWTLAAHLQGSTERWRSVGRLGTTQFAAAYLIDGLLVTRDLTSGETIWARPLIDPGIDRDRPAPGANRLELIEFAPDGSFVLSYESRPEPGTGAATGTVVLRQALDGAVLAMYDVAGVTDLSIAPDGARFTYSARAGGRFTLLAATPRDPAERQ